MESASSPVLDCSCMPPCAHVTVSQSGTIKNFYSNVFFLWPKAQRNRELSNNVLWKLSPSKWKTCGKWERNEKWTSLKLSEVRFSGNAYCFLRKFNVNKSRTKPSFINNMIHLHPAYLYPILERSRSISVILMTFLIRATLTKIISHSPE